MEVYRLNDSLENESLIEGYESVIWTDRFREHGDFEITFPLKFRQAFDRLPIGTYLGTDVSDRIMRVDTREMDRNEDGQVTLKVSGESLEAILKKRIAWTDRFKESISEQFVMEGPVKEIIENMIRRAGFSPNTNHPAFDGAVNLNDPRWTRPRAIFDRVDYPLCTLDDPGEAVVVKDRPMATYDYILELCRAYNVGYRMFRKPGHNSTYDIFVNVYQGRDLTRNQSVDRPVVFSADHENLKNESMLESIRDHYRGVWVWDTHDDGPDRTGVFLPDYTGVPEAGGLDMRTGFLVVSAPDESTPAEREAYRQQQGVDFLNERGTKELVDGEANKACIFKCGRDYHLGDRVEVETQFNSSAHMRVIEQIYVSDGEGERSYPTLEAETVVNQDSWLAQPVARVWSTATGSWIDV